MPKRISYHLSSRRNAASGNRPHFMTPSMWFAWLLRGDVRQDAATDDPEAQQEFVAWWLLWGRGEYPAVWHWGSVQAVVAMRLVPTSSVFTCPRLLRRLHASRPDLQNAFTLQDQESLAEYFCWYRVVLPLELAAAPQLPAICLAMTEAPSQRQPWSACGRQVPRIAITLAHRSHPGLLSGKRCTSPAQAVPEWYWKERPAPPANSDTAARAPL